MDLQLVLAPSRWVMLGGILGSERAVKSPGLECMSPNMNVILKASHTVCIVDAHINGPTKFDEYFRRSLVVESMLEGSETCELIRP